MIYSELTDEELNNINIYNLTKTDQKELLKEIFKRKVNFFIENTIIEYEPITINELKPELYLYKDGYYHALGDNILMQMCHEEFHHANTPALFKDILHKIKSYHIVERKDFTEPENKINLSNGVLNVYTKELEPHNPKYNFLYKLNINYNPKSKCSNTLKFLRDICSNDNKKLLCIIEFLGFCLISGYPIKKFLMILGRGDNGKSTLEYLIRTFFGNENNVTGLTIQDICDTQFLASRLYGKRLNIRGEMKQLKLNSIEMLKSLTGGDVVTVDRKNRDMIDLHPSCKFIFHFNKLPLVDISNMDNQSWKRIMLIELTNKFTGKNDNKNIRNKLVTDEELEGLLNFALIGLYRLRKNRQFTYDDELTYDRWMDYVEIDHENPLSDFVDDYLVLGQIGSYVPQIYLYNIYLKSEYSKSTMFSKNMFTRLLNTFPGVSVAKKGIKGMRYKTYEGVMLKTPSEQIIKHEIETENVNEIKNDNNKLDINNEIKNIIEDNENPKILCVKCKRELEYLANICKCCGTGYRWD